MQFRYEDGSVVPTNETDVLFVRPLRWNDWWQWKTSFYVTYVDPDGTKIDIGGVKIAKTDQEYVRSTLTNGDRTELKSRFTTLNSSYLSVGQDESYYRNLHSALGSERFHQVLGDLKDIAYRPTLLDKYRATPVVQESLLRDVPETSVRGVFRRIIDGVAAAATYQFKYTRPSAAPSWLANPLELDFEVRPESKPPTNVHVLIGRNGSGKTTLLSSLTRVLLGIGNKMDGEVVGADGQPPQLANLVHIGFSAFDVVDVPVRDDPRAYNIAYSYVGLHYIGSKRKSAADFDHGDTEDLRQSKRTRPAEDLNRAFSESAWRVIGAKSRDLWRDALGNLESDPNFADAQVSALADYSLDDGERAFKADASELFGQLSSGHKIVLLSVTRLVQTVTEQSIVLIDEPEGHLHPPLLAAFIRTLSDLMQVRNGMAIIATHSPVILQEVPRKCVWRVGRNGNIQTADRPDRETFGENVGVLTSTVFGLEVTASGFNKMLIDEALTLGSYDAVVQAFHDELGFEARALLRAWFANRVER